MFEVQKLYHSCLAETVLFEVFLQKLKEIGVDVRDYPEHRMWLLDYNQIECVKNHPVVNECRGLLMDYSGNIVRKGFGRFYNLGENGVDSFDFENSIAFEKADGSLCFVYYCPATKQWEIGTRGTAFAEGPHEWHGTFRQAMLKAMGKTEAEFQYDCKSFDEGVTRLYEYISPDNRIVTPYKESMLVALSYVNNITGEEVVAPGAAIERHKMGWNVRPIREYKFNSQEDCYKALHDLSGLEEGYVVYNTKTKERVKIKSPTYLAAHRLRGNGLTLNAICELVAMNEHDEYLAVFPEDKPKFEAAVYYFHAMRVALMNNYLAACNYMKAYEGLPTAQKEFALYVKDMPLSSVMFSARRYSRDVLEVFNEVPVQKKADWLKEGLQK